MLNLNARFGGRLSKQSDRSNNAGMPLPNPQSKYAPILLQTVTSINCDVHCSRFNFVRAGSKILTQRILDHTARHHDAGLLRAAQSSTSFIYRMWDSKRRWNYRLVGFYDRHFYRSDTSTHDWRTDADPVKYLSYPTAKKARKVCHLVGVCQMRSLTESPLRKEKRTG